MNGLSGIGLLTSFAAGVISFLSPCVLPLVPGYVSYVAGERSDSRVSRLDRSPPCASAFVSCSASRPSS